MTAASTSSRDSQAPNACSRRAARASPVPLRRHSSAYVLPARPLTKSAVAFLSMTLAAEAGHACPCHQVVSLRTGDHAHNCRSKRGRFGGLLDPFADLVAERRVVRRSRCSRVDPLCVWVRTHAESRPWMGDHSGSPSTTSGSTGDGQNGRMAKDSLTADDVVRVALELLDEVGLRGFTMRALADRLDTYPATIYWHVGSRHAVLSRVNDLVLGSAFSELPDPAGLQWEDWMRAHAHVFRGAMHAHPALAAFAVGHLEAGVAVPESLEDLTLVLSRAGLRGPALAGAFNAYLGSLIGWVALELIPDDPEIGFDPEAMETSVRELPAESYPTLDANREHFADQAFAFRWHGGVSRPMDDAFSFALETWIGGLRVHPDRRGGPEVRTPLS